MTVELFSISQVSKAYDISSRMLRYYENAGLLKSSRNKDNDYRLYDSAALKRVQQIIILRKLQIPVKQINVIVDNPDAVTVIDIFRKNISELDSEITALSTIKLILDKFMRELEKKAGFSLNLDFLGDDSVLKLTGGLSMIQRNVKESITMIDYEGYLSKLGGYGKYPSDDGLDRAAPEERKARAVRLQQIAGYMYNAWSFRRVFNDCYNEKLRDSVLYNELRDPAFSELWSKIHKPHCGTLVSAGHVMNSFYGSWRVKKTWDWLTIDLAEIPEKSEWICKTIASVKKADMKLLELTNKAIAILDK